MGRANLLVVPRTLRVVAAVAEQVDRTGKRLTGHVPVYLVSLCLLVYLVLALHCGHGHQIPYEHGGRSDTPPPEARSASSRQATTSDAVVVGDNFGGAQSPSVGSGVGED